MIKSDPFFLPTKTVSKDQIVNTSRKIQVMSSLASAHQVLPLLAQHGAAPQRVRLQFQDEIALISLSGVNLITIDSETHTSAKNHSTHLAPPPSAARTG